MRNIPFEHPKLNFAIECKNLQAQLNNGDEKGLILNSVILSETPWTDPLVASHTSKEWRSKNVFFMDSPNYIFELFDIIRNEI